jgi:predicted SprT family Zn-dependent metalloprotease
MSAAEHGTLLAEAGRLAEGRVQRELKRLQRVFGEQRVADIRIRPSRRLSASLALAYPQRGEIALAVPVLASKHLEEILAHEVAHFVCWWRHGRTRPHGPEWQAIMQEAGHTPRVRLVPDDITMPPRRRRKARRRPTRVRLYSFLRDLL